MDPGSLSDDVLDPHSGIKRRKRVLEDDLGVSSESLSLLFTVRKHASHEGVPVFVELLEVSFGYLSIEIVLKRLNCGFGRSALAFQLDESVDVCVSYIFFGPLSKLNL